jgi:hypothetical protein
MLGLKLNTEDVLLIEKAKMISVSSYQSRKRASIFLRREIPNQKKRRSKRWSSANILGGETDYRRF